MKKPWIAVSAVVVAAIVLYTWYTFPKDIDVTVEGINYQLGEGNEGNVKPGSVAIHGIVYKTITGKRIFKGSVVLEGEAKPEQLQGEDVKVEFGGLGGGLLFYSYNDEYGKAKAYVQGQLYANADFSRIMILKYIEYKATDGRTGSGWNGNDGLMFTGPAESREEALKLANELGRDFLQGNSFQ